MWNKSLQAKTLSFIFQDGIYKQESFHQIYFRKIFSKVYEKIRLLGYQLLSESENEISTFMHSDKILL